jgi:phosphoglycolate phosphatase-like HAD superfamily hydrolase
VKPLEALLSRASGAVVVFDLDDTLFLTAQRHLRILREYAAVDGAARPLAELGPAALHYSIVDTAKAAGLDDAGFLSSLRDFWFARFFKNEYLSSDEPVPGAAQYCRELESAGARLVYMTGRDEAMRAGTESALAAHGFPTRHDLILKPRFDTPDLEFKTAALARVREMGAVAGAFENEPLHVNLFRDAFPDALIFLLETKHSGRPVEPHPSAIRLRDFRR